MNQIPPGKALQLTDEEQAAVASLKVALRRGRHGRGREGRELSLATLTVLGGLSLGAVAGLAYLSEEGEHFSWLAAAVLNPASKPSLPARPPVRSRAAEAQHKSSEPALVTAASAAPVKAQPRMSDNAAGPAAAEAKPKPSEPPVMAAAPAPPPRLGEPIQTASISPAVRLPPMTLPPQGLPPAEPLARAPEAKPVEPSAPPRPLPQARPAVSPAEAEGYLAKAEAALRSGDLIVARSFFGRLAQAGDPRGALGMARTYDEAELRKLPVFGLKPDRAEAERWRLRAREMTSAVARN